MKGGFSLMWIILILKFSSEAFGQISSGDFEFSGNDLLLRGKEAIDRGEFEYAIELHNQFLENFSIENDTLAYVYTLDQIGYCYRRLGDFEKARDYLVRAEHACRLLLGPAHPQMGKIYYHWAYFHYINKNRKPDSALFFMQKSVKIRKNTLSPDDPDLAESYHGMGSMYKFMFNNYREAIKYYSKAVKIKEACCSESPDLAYSYLYLGQTLYSLDDAYAALPYLKAAYRIYDANPQHNPGRRKRAITSLGNVYYYLQDYPNAILYYKETIEFTRTKSNDPSDMITPLMNLAMAYIDAEKFDLAKEILYKLISLNSSNGAIVDSVDQSFIFADLAIMHYSQNNVDSALYYFKNSIEVNSRPESEKPLISRSYSSIGDIYLGKNMFQESLQNYQSAIESLEGKSDYSENTLHNPNPDEIVYPILAFGPISGKANVNFRQYRYNDSRTSLIKAVQQYEYIAYLSNIIKTSPNLSDETKLEFTRLAANDASDALECLVEARKIDLYPEKEIVHDIFEIMEENRYVQLLSNLVNLKNSKRLNVPDSLLQNEKTLIAQINNYQVSLNNTSDSQERQQIEKQQFAGIRELEKLQEYLHVNYPQYYKKNNPYSTLEEVQKSLSPDQQLIEYFWSDSVLYALSASHDELKFEVIKVSEGLVNSIRSLRQFQAESKTLEADFNFYKNIAWNIYEQLLSPLIFESTTQLIVSPGGLLNFIPFEALLTDVNGNNFRDASYVLKKWDIRYVYSGSLLVENSDRRITSSPSLLAMSYSDIDTPSVIANRNGPAAIPASAIEVKMISEIFGNGTNRYFIGENASKQKFKEVARGYQIIHLAVHGYSDTILAINSHLQFRAGKNENDDGRLYAHELYNLNLESLELAVLSACETGLGKQYRGEGVFSMARGFAYAGCPTTVMSLWKTDDSRTAELMQYFYTYLNKGYEVSQALRLAKLDYIQNNDSRFSHPYYWAGFVSLGSDDPVVKKNDYMKLFMVVGFMILVVSFVVIRRKKRHAG